MSALRKLISLLRPFARSILADPSVSLPLEEWWKSGFWEPTVALAIRDHCRPGDVVFDVGANAGGLSVMLSRLVGPRGIVCAFEASPRIIDKTHHNLVKAGCHNVTLFHKAVWHTTGELVHIASDSHLNDHIDKSGSGMPVRTLALDDLMVAGNVRPSFIKMDIEGAELDALKGMPRLLREVRPVIVLEQAPEDMRCHDLMMEAGYDAMDLATYRKVKGRGDFASSSGVVNILFVPREAARDSPYFSDQSHVLVTTKPAEDFLIGRRGSISARDAVKLVPGQCIVVADFTADGTDNEIFAGVEADGEDIFRNHTYTRFMALCYAHWPIQIDKPAAIRPFLRIVRGRDPTLQWKGVHIYRVGGFDQWKPPVLGIASSLDLPNYLLQATVAIRTVAGAGCAACGAGLRVWRTNPMDLSLAHPAKPSRKWRTPCSRGSVHAKLRG